MAQQRTRRTMLSKWSWPQVNLIQIQVIDGSLKMWTLEVRILESEVWKTWFDQIFRSRSGSGLRSFHVTCHISRASDSATPLKLFLLMECNSPVRHLLFYVLRYESGTWNLNSLNSVSAVRLTSDHWFWSSINHQWFSSNSMIQLSLSTIWFNN